MRLQRQSGQGGAQPHWDASEVHGKVQDASRRDAWGFVG